jgi:hypothetical protein
VKKAALLFFTVLFLIGNTEFHELLKAPLLVIHYFEHKTETPGITPAQFLALHYNQQHTTDNDNNRDNQLPFKTDEHIPASPVMLFISHYTVKVPVPHHPVTNDVPVYRSLFLPHNLLCSIWQPPKC